MDWKVKRFISQVPLVVIFSRNLTHQFIKQGEIGSKSFIPNVMVSGIELKSRSSDIGLLFVFPSHRKSAVELVNHPKAVQGNIMTQWMTQNSVIPLSKDRDGTTDYFHDGGWQEGKVLPV